MIHRNPGLADVLDLFDKTAFPEKEYNGSSLDDIFHRIEMLFPECYAAREYFSWRAMPEKTAASVRATLKGALNAVFPEDIRNMMKDKPQVDFQKLGSKKMDIPFEDVLYAPIGNIFVMASGRKPAVIPRYNTFQSIEYQEYLNVNHLEYTADSGETECRPKPVSERKR